jgi:hypothetical protein
VLKEFELKSGTNVTGKIIPTDEGLADVALRISLTELVDQQNDRESKLVRTLAFDIRTVATLGQSVRLDCSDSQWCELTLDPVQSRNELSASDPSPLTRAAKREQQPGVAEAQ